MLTKGVLYYEFYLHPIWTSQSSLYGVWTFWQIQPRFASWPHKFATLLDPSILSGREGLYHPGFAIAKRTRAIWRLFFHFEDKERHFMRLAQCKMSRSKHFETLDVEIIIYRLYILYVQFLNLYCVSRWSYSPVVTGWFESDTAAEMSFLRQTQRGLRYLGMEFCEGRAGSNVVCWRIDDFPCYKSQSIKYKGNFPASPVWRPKCRSQTTLSFNSAVRSSGYLLSPTHLVGCVQIISKAWCVWRIMEHSVIHSIFPELDGDKKSRNTNFDQKINGFPKFALKPIQRPQKCADFFRWRRQPLR
jgi:hypothetical protein